MKLEAIEISGFGRLREVTVDFSPRFTVLVGDNESGKSTVQRAVRAALYGIDAGGQGRAVERSEWHRWMPWSPGPYAVALRYALDDGRRLRVTRRLEQREQEVQVLELGAKDITAQLRIGRIVAPARFHLGIDEAVFCATACLAEDALQLGSPDGLPQRADRVREAIERLVDSGRGVNAAAALARIEEAINRVGSERRVTTPLGAATARLRQLDTELESARRRSAVVSAEQRRLVELERIATSDEARCLDLEKAWLRERLAGIAIQVSELDTAEREEEALSAELHELERFARFPLHNEERVISLSGEVQQCAANAERAEQAWRAAQSELAGVRTRRREIANTIDALAAPDAADEETLQTAKGLEQALLEEAGTQRRVEEARAAEARCQSLRQEIAATGLATLDANDLETTANLLDDALDSGAGSRGLTWAAVGIGLLSLITTVVSLVAGIDRVALGILIGGGVTAMVMALGASISGRHSRLALRELEVRCPALDLSPTALRGAVARLPALRRLQTELRSQEVIAEAHRNEIELSRQRAADLAGQCDELLTELGLQLPALHLRPIEEPNSIEALVTRGRAAVSAVIDAVDAARWRDTLHKEDATLEERETDLLRLGEEAQDRADEHAQLEARLRRGLAECGVASDSDLQQALGFFRHACAARRRHDECSEALFAVRRRKSALGVNRGQLGRLAAHLSAELRARGGDPEAPLRANQENGTVPAPFDPNHLQALEREVEFARRRSTSARASAGELRARLSGTLEGLPNLADLEDERAVCAAARERALRQLEALKLAATVIGASTEGVHRALAPRLAESVGRRLALLSEGRYREVSVAMEDFRVSMLGIERPDFIPLELLSQGTRDQVSLLLRLALCEALGERRESIPLLLDEPLLTADRSRREAALDFLVALSESNQVVLAASDPDVAERVERRLGSECAVVAMRRPQGALSLRD